MSRKAFMKDDHRKSGARGKFLPLRGSEHPRSDEHGVLPEVGSQRKGISWVNEEKSIVPNGELPLHHDTGTCSPSM